MPNVANNLAALIADFAYHDNSQLKLALTLASAFAASENPYFLDTLGWVYFRAGNFQQALSYLEQSVAKVPNAPQMQFHLGMTYRALGQTGKAREALEQALVEGAEYPGIQTARCTLELYNLAARSSNAAPDTCD